MEAERKRLVIDNGSLLHERLITTSNGRYNSFHIFSAEELKRATNNNDPRCIFGRNELGTWCKGDLQGQTVSICIAPDQDPLHKSYDDTISEYVNDIAVAAQVSGHKNMLKLIGCCLETQVPSLVYECVENGNLYDRIYVFGRAHSQPMPWKCRLKIAREIAHAVAFLHTAFSRPIIHRGISVSNIFLDEHNVAKLSNFSQSMYINEGETVMIDTIVGTIGYLSPEYLEWGEVTEKFDVYSFGTLLLELLTGRRPHNWIARKAGYFKFWMNNVEGHFAGNCLKYYVECHSIDEAVDWGLLEDGGRVKEQQQWQDVVELALTCLETAKEKRPTMVEVTKQLWLIERSSSPVPEMQKEIFDDKWLFMEEFIADHEGKCSPLQRFSAKELQKATNSFSPDSIFSCSNVGIWYKGDLGNGVVSVCKIKRANWQELVKNEFKIAAQLSDCKNVLKLLGCCLDKPIPTLVYEPAENWTLFSHLHFPFFSLSWSRRLKIAIQIADGVAGLHTSFSLPIINKNIQSSNVFLDKDYVPKLANFPQGISINNGESLTTFQLEGTKGYMAPEYYNDGVVTEKVDVYSFGVLLVELLIGSKLFDQFHFVDKQGGLLLDHLKILVDPQFIKKVVDPVILTDLTLENETTNNEQWQWEAVGELAFKCTKTVKEERPTMLEVAAALKLILKKKKLSSSTSF